MLLTRWLGPHSLLSLLLTHPGLTVQGVSNPEGQALLHQLAIKETSHRLVWQRCIFSIAVPSSQMTAACSLPVRVNLVGQLRETLESLGRQTSFCV